MKAEAAVGAGRPGPVYPHLTDYLVTHGDVPDVRTRFVLAVCSAYAYGDIGTVATIMDRLGLTNNRCRMICEWVDALFLTSVAYLIQSHDGRVAILCYRGTPPTSAITWLTDFELEPVRIHVPGLSAANKGEVHGGFYRNVRSTRFKIIELLQDAMDGKSVLEPEDEPPAQPLEVLYVTGHSLGGASASLFAALLVGEPIKYGNIKPDTPQKILDRLRAVYTYGAPMVGNPAFAKACAGHTLLSDSVIRYVYADDVVPQVPPKASGPFEHFGKEYRCPPHGKAADWHPSKPREQSSIVELATAPLALVAKSLKLTRRVRFHASLSDHLPQYYLDALTPEGVRSEFGD